MKQLKSTKDYSDETIQLAEWLWHSGDDVAWREWSTRNGILWELSGFASRLADGKKWHHERLFWEHA